MVKKKSGKSQEAKAAKVAKSALKTDKKVQKKITKSKARVDSDEDSDEDLEGILDKLAKEWELAHAVTEELSDGPPSKRASATLTTCPNAGHLWFIGGEFFSEDGKAHFYNDTYRYTPDKNEWRRFVSPTCPGPRSAHAVVASPANGGQLFLFGGEFSSLHQTSFHHYRDLWCFEIKTHSWNRIDTKLRPSGRSGHRMALWKHYVILFGGFIDPGIITKYLNDTWIFDTQTYLWKQIDFKENDRKPSPRSGFSFLSTAEGIVLHGGYFKEYAKGKRPIGVMLEDTWFLKISSDENSNFPSFKWDRRKRPSTSYAPSCRVGCTMALWSAKSMGVMFGGVTDEDTNEETLESVFWQDLNGYQLSGNGRWMSLTLKKPKKKTSVPCKQTTSAAFRVLGTTTEDADQETGDGIIQFDGLSQLKPTSIEDNDHPSTSIPMGRYNSMLAVLRNTLYIYGGIFERRSREYTLDDFYSIQLDKLDAYVCLKPSTVSIPKECDDESSSDDDDECEKEDEDDDEDAATEIGSESEIIEDQKEIATLAASVNILSDSSHHRLSKSSQQTVHKGLSSHVTEYCVTASSRKSNSAFMESSTNETRSAEDVISTPLPGETLAVFYSRSREHWAGKAIATSDNRGKMLRRDGFALAEDRYNAYKPMLEEVERILAEAGLDEEEMRKGASATDPGNPGQSRNRR